MKCDRCGNEPAHKYVAMIVLPRLNVMGAKPYKKRRCKIYRCDECAAQLPIKPKAGHSGWKIWKDSPSTSTPAI